MKRNNNKPIELYNGQFKVDAIFFATVNAYEMSYCFFFKCVFFFFLSFEYLPRFSDRIPHYKCDYAIHSVCVCVDEILY